MCVFGLVLAVQRGPGLPAVPLGLWEQLALWVCGIGGTMCQGSLGAPGATGMGGWSPEVELYPPVGSRSAGLRVLGLALEHYSTIFFTEIVLQH